MSDYRDVMGGGPGIEELRSQAKSAKRIRDMARDNVTDAERGLEIARLAAAQAETNYFNAAKRAGQL